MHCIPSRRARWPLALAVCAATPLAFAGIETNGGFESGNLNGWSVSGDSSFIGVVQDIGHTGNFGAYFGPDPTGAIAQTLTTGAGKTYQVKFWLALDDSAAPNSFSWSWNGVVQSSLSNAAAFGYVAFSGLVSASSTATTLRFDFANPASFWRLDDVTVTAVPEPASLALWALGLLAIVTTVRTRSHRHAA